MWLTNVRTESGFCNTSVIRPAALRQNWRAGGGGGGRESFEGESAGGGGQHRVGWGGEGHTCRPGMMVDCATAAVAYRRRRRLVNRMRRSTLTAWYTLVATPLSRDLFPDWYRAMKIICSNSFHSREVGRWFFTVGWLKITFRLLGRSIIVSKALPEGTPPPPPAANLTTQPCFTSTMEFLPHKLPHHGVIRGGGGEEHP